MSNQEQIFHLTVGGDDKQRNVSIAIPAGVTIGDYRYKKKRTDHLIVLGKLILNTAW